MLASVALPALAIAPWLAPGRTAHRPGPPTRRRRAIPSAAEGIGRSLASAPGIRILIFGNWRRWSARPRLGVFVRQGA